MATNVKEYIAQKFELISKQTPKFIDLLKKITAKTSKDHILIDTSIRFLIIKLINFKNEPYSLPKEKIDSIIKEIDKFNSKDKTLTYHEPGDVTSQKEKIIRLMREVVLGFKQRVPSRFTNRVRKTLRISPRADIPVFSNRDKVGSMIKDIEKIYEIYFKYQELLDKAIQTKIYTPFFDNKPDPEVRKILFLLISVYSKNLSNESMAGGSGRRSSSKHSNMVNDSFEQIKKANKYFKNLEEADKILMSLKDKHKDTDELKDYSNGDINYYDIETIEILIKILESIYNTKSTFSKFSSSRLPHLIDILNEIIEYKKYEEKLKANDEKDADLIAEIENYDPGNSTTNSPISAEDEALFAQFERNYGVTKGGYRKNIKNPSKTKFKKLTKKLTKKYKKLN